MRGRSLRRADRMKRHALNFLTILSLLLCVSAVASWARSTRRYDLVAVRLGTVAAGVVSYRGHLLWVWATDSDDDGEADAHHGSGSRSPQVDAISDYVLDAAVWQVLGFSYIRLDLDGGTPLRGLTTPNWSVALAAAVLPAARLWRRRTSRRRVATGLCPACGYDLRATPEQCPECGAARSNRK